MHFANVLIRQYRSLARSRAQETVAVYEAFSRASEQTVALKIVASNDERAWTEVDILRMVAHSDLVVRLSAAYVHDGKKTNFLLFFFFFFLRMPY
jgi:hypothetical protein